MNGAVDESVSEGLAEEVGEVMDVDSAIGDV